MREDKHIPNDNQPLNTPTQKIDYSPKTYTRGDHFRIIVKFLIAALAIGAIFVFYELR